MGKLRVGIPGELYSRPLAWGFLKGHYEGLITPSLHPPAVIAQLLRQRNLDVGLVSPLDYQELEHLKVIPNLCVALAGPSRSVVLAMNRPLEEVESIAVEPNGGATEALLRIVLLEDLGQVPPLVPHQPIASRMLESHDAALVTGDAALRLDDPKVQTLDLAQRWSQLTGHPWVASFWACREEVALNDVTFYFKSSLRFGLAAMDSLVREYAAQIDVEVADVKDSLEKSVRYLLRAGELAGLEEFYRRANRLGLMTTVQPLRYIS
ncbi:MAG: hypothetical protein K0U98_27830 [Deltaproteobacteria bacterium]|nr:hypothetical protein [Deltaproteobacteria bacterium]